MRKRNAWWQWLSLCLMTAILSACSSGQKTITSAAGRKACLDEVASGNPLASQQDKQAAYRTCLQSIDQRLEAQKQRTEQEARQAAQLAEQQRAREVASWAPNSERFSYCKANQDRVIDLEKQRIRAYARLLASSSARNPDRQLEQDAQAAYNSILAEFDRVLPARMRAGQPLVPDAIEQFRRCSPESFSS